MLDGPRRMDNGVINHVLVAETFFLFVNSMNGKDSHQHLNAKSVIAKTQNNGPQKTWKRGKKLPGIGQEEIPLGGERGCRMSENKRWRMIDLFSG